MIPAPYVEYEAVDGNKSELRIRWEGESRTVNRTTLLHKADALCTRRHQHTDRQTTQWAMCRNDVAKELIEKGRIPA